VRTLSKPTGELIEIMPAAGFRALFFSTDSGGPFAVPLVAFGLVERDGGLREIEGYIAGDKINSAETRANFLRYIGPAERADEYKKEAEIAWKMRQEEGRRDGGGDRT
jgi:hypothetical protein